MMKVFAARIQPAFVRLLPLLIVSLIGTSRMLDMPSFLYASTDDDVEVDPGDAGTVFEEPEEPDPVVEYDDGWFAGYGDGYNGSPEADVSNESPEFQTGYADGYAIGVFDAESEIDPNEEYDDGWYAGYGDGYPGNPEADVTGESSSFQAGYADGYGAGVHDAESEAGENPTT